MHTYPPYSEQQSCQRLAAFQGRLRLSIEQNDRIESMSSNEFHTTNWSIVLRAGRADDADARAALATLCQRYWYPLYVFVRRKGIDHDQAEDVTQGFFARTIETHALEKASPARGRFRSFLLASLQNFLANERDHANAQKRGGGKGILSLDVATGEARMRWEPAHDLTPEKIFDRVWAVQLLEIVLGKLRREFVDKGLAADFEKLQTFLTGRNVDESYERVALELGKSQTALRQSVHRLRKRYRELLRAEVADTVGEEDEIDDEMRSLFAALAS